MSEKMQEEQLIRLNERTIEDLKKSVMESKKKVAEKQNQIGLLKKRVRDFEADCDSASKRMNLLSFEYFDVAKKEKIKRQNGKAKKV